MTFKIERIFAVLVTVLAMGGGGGVASPVSAQTRPPNPPRPPSRWFRSNGGSLSRIDTLVPFSTNGSVELGLVAGSIRVAAWNRNQVRVVASTTAGTAMDFDVTESHIDLGLHRDWSGGSGSATYDVTVPIGTRVTLSSVSGTISAAGVKGGIDANAVSGSIDVRNAGSSVAVEGVSGAVTVLGVSGDVKVETVSGPIQVSDVSGTVSAENVSGSIEMSDTRGTRVRANSVSGSIAFTGALSSEGRYEFETHSGQVALRLASGANASISVDTYSGSVSNEYPGAVRRPESDADDERTSYRYTIGRGAARVSIDTFSGRVIISQGNR